MKRLLGILLVLVVAGCEDRSRPLPESPGHLLPLRMPLPR